jgi:hypothetical protein
MEERHSLVDHRASFKTQGMKEFADKVQEYIDKSINRNTTEVEALKQIVAKYKGREVQFITTADKSGSYNSAPILVIDWKEEKSKSLPVYQRFLKTPFASEYLPFGYAKKNDGKETLYLCEILDTPSPWIRCYNDESSNTWVGHYYGNSIRNCAIIPYTMPAQYIGLNAQKLVIEFEALLKEGDVEKIKAAGFENADHLKYALEIGKGNIVEGFAEAQAVLDETNAKLKKEMNKNIDAAKKGGLLDPIKGISLEDWAAANVKISQAMPLADVLKVLGVEKPVWDDVSAQWMSRMAQDTTFAISKVYGDAFTNPNIGKFAKTGAASTSAGSGAVEKVKNDFDLYVKIMCHQSMGSIQGLDANAVLKQYGLTAADWGMVSGHWAPQMTTNLDIAMRMSSLMEKYNAEFASAAPAKAGDDISF